MRTISKMGFLIYLPFTLSISALTFGEMIDLDLELEQENQMHPRYDTKNDTLKGDWPIVGQDYLNSRVNLNEKKINAQNVSRLKKIWGQISHATSGSAIHSQITVDGKSAYGADSGGNVIAFNALSGEVIWKTRAADREAFLSSPTITKKNIYISASKLFCIDRKTGRIKWQKPLYEPGKFNAQCSTNATVAGNLVIVGISSKTLSPTFRGSLVAFNKKTGNKVWEFFTTSDQTQPTPEFGPGLGILSTPALDLERSVIYVGTGNSYNGSSNPLSNALLAIDLNKGKLLWSYKFNLGSDDELAQKLFEYNFSGCELNGHPNLFNVKTPSGTQELIGMGCNDGTYRIFNRLQTNPNAVQPLILLKLAPEAFMPGAIVSAVVQKDILYLSSSAALDPSDERISLNYAAFPFNYGSTSLKTTALDLRTLLHQGNLDGSIPRQAIIWERTTPGFSISNALTYANGVLYQTSVTGFLRALDARSGEELWKDTPLSITNATSPFTAAIVGGVTVVNGRLYVGLGYEYDSITLPGGGVVAYELPN